MGEAGTGFGFLAIMIAYLPTLYGGFSQREVNISLLDARAGSPPTAAELLRRHGRQRILDDGSLSGVSARDWEIWSAQLMETHLSYPFLCFFRSQHDNLNSTKAAFTAILDVCALLIAYGEGETKWQAQLTFAISRHPPSLTWPKFCVFIPIRHTPIACPRRICRRCASLLVDCGVPKAHRGGRPETQGIAPDVRAAYSHGLSRLLWMPLPSWGLDVVSHAKSYDLGADRFAGCRATGRGNRRRVISEHGKLARTGLTRRYFSRAFRGARVALLAAPLQIAVLLKARASWRGGIFRPRKLAAGFCANRAEVPLGNCCFPETAPSS